MESQDDIIMSDDTSVLPWVRCSYQEACLVTCFALILLEEGEDREDGEEDGVGKEGGRWRGGEERRGEEREGEYERCE